MPEYRVDVILTNYRALGIVRYLALVAKTYGAKSISSCEQSLIICLGKIVWKYLDIRLCSGFLGMVGLGTFVTM